jgi:hypothetical protein
MTAWDTWITQLTQVSGVEYGAIYTKAGAICADSGVGMSFDEIIAAAAAIGGDATSFKIGGKSWMILRRDDVGGYLSARAGAKPMAIFETRGLLLVAMGKDNAAAGMIEVHVARLQESLRDS